MRDFGKALKYYRNKCGMTQAELAEKLSVSNQTVSKWENGVNVPAADVIGDICNILSVSLADFFAYAENGMESGDSLAQLSCDQTTPVLAGDTDGSTPTVGDAPAAAEAQPVVNVAGVKAFFGKIKARLGKDFPFVIISIVLAIAVFLALLFSILSGRSYSAEQIYERVNPSVVCLYVDRADGNKVSGSGFYIDGNGKTVTNYHVIENAKSIYLYNYKGQRYNVTEVVSVDVDNDIAILQTEARRTPSVKIGNSDKVKTGEKVYAIGYPQSFILGNVDSTFTEGTISKSSYAVNGVNYIQSTVNITNGNSGGVLLNSRAEVIGITTAGLDLNNIDYMNFSVPINNVRTVKYTVNIPVESFATDFKFYTVNFYADGSLYRSYTVLHNEILEEIVMPEEDDMLYDGWGKGGIRGENYDFTQPVQSDLNLYLKRKSAYYVVSFSVNGGTGIQEDDRCRYENKLTLPQCNLTKTAYKFVGWEFNGVVYNPGDTFENSANISSVNFTAQWERTGFFVNYRSETEGYEEAFSIGEAVTLNTCAFTRVGYKFAGWDIDGVTYDAGDIYDNTSNKEIVYVYPSWEPISYTLIIKNFSGSIIFNEAVLYTDVIDYVVPDDCEPGYEQMGWKDSNGKTYPITLTKLTEVDGYKVVLLPTRKVITYSVTYYVQGVSSSYEIRCNGKLVKDSFDAKRTLLTTVTAAYNSKPEEPTLTDGRNLVFNGWDYYVDGVLFTGDTHYLTTDKTAQIMAIDKWISSEYYLYIYKREIDYYIGVQPQLSILLSGYEEYTLPTGNEDWLKKDGYVFNCWNIDFDEFETSYKGGATISNLMLNEYYTGYNDKLPYIIIYPEFRGCKWTIEFDGNGGEGSMAPVVYEYSTIEVLPVNTFTKEGYVFDGWEYDGNVYWDGYIFNTEILMDGDGTAVFKAIWIEDEQSEEVN